MAIGKDKKAVENTPAEAPVPTVERIVPTNPEPFSKVVKIAEVKLRKDDFEKPVLIRLQYKVEGKDIMLLSPKQADMLAESINIFAPGETGWKLMKTIVGNHKSDVEIQVQKYVAGSQYTDKSGIIVTREQAGVVLFPQLIMLPLQTQQSMDTKAINSVQETWVSAAVFAPRPVTTGSEEDE